FPVTPSPWTWRTGPWSCADVPTVSSLPLQQHTAKPPADRNLPARRGLFVSEHRHGNAGHLTVRLLPLRRRGTHSPSDGSPCISLPHPCLRFYPLGKLSSFLFCNAASP